jgi:hypothetical protein
MVYLTAAEAASGAGGSKLSGEVLRSLPREARGAAGQFDPFKFVRRAHALGCKTAVIKLHKSSPVMEGFPNPSPG